MNVKALKVLLENIEDLQKLQNPNLSTDKVKSIYQDHITNDNNDDVMRAIASHPSADFMTLFHLHQRYPDEIAQNPALPLHTMEDPGVHEPNEIVRKVMYDDVHPFFLEYLAKHPDRSVRSAIALHPNTPIQTIQNMNIHGLDSDILARVLDREDIPKDVLDLAVKHHNHNKSVLFAVTRHPNTSPETLEGLSNNLDPDVQLGVSQNKKAHPELLHKIATREGDSTIPEGRHYGLAENPNILPKTVDHLMSFDDNYIHERLAGNPATHTSALFNLIHPKKLTSNVYQNLISNHSANVTPEILHTLAERPMRNEAMKLGIVAHPNVGIDTLRSLTSNRNSQVSAKASYQLRKKLMNGGK